MKSSKFLTTIKFLSLFVIPFYVNGALFSAIKSILPQARAFLGISLLSINLQLNSENNLKSVDFVPYVSPDNLFSLQHPNDLIESPKLLKTHDVEVFFKSSATKGFNAGVTVRCNLAYVDNILLLLLCFYSGR